MKGRLNTALFIIKESWVITHKADRTYRQRFPVSSLLMVSVNRNFHGGDPSATEFQEEISIKLRLINRKIPCIFPGKQGN